MYNAIGVEFYFSYFYGFKNLSFKYYETTEYIITLCNSNGTIPNKVVGNGGIIHSKSNGGIISKPANGGFPSPKLNGSAHHHKPFSIAWSPSVTAGLESRPEPGANFINTVSGLKHNNSKLTDSFASVPNCQNYYLAHTCSHQGKINIFVSCAATLQLEYVRLTLLKQKIKC